MFFHVGADESWWFPEKEDMSAGVWTESQVRGKKAVVTTQHVPLAKDSRISNALSSIPGLSCKFPGKASADWTTLIEMEMFLILTFTCSHLNLVFVLDRISADLASTAVCAAGHHLESPCGSVS